MDNDLAYSNPYPVANHKSPNSFLGAELLALHACLSPFVIPTSTQDLNDCSTALSCSIKPLHNQNTLDRSPLHIGFQNRHLNTQLQPCQIDTLTTVENILFIIMQGHDFSG